MRVLLLLIFFGLPTSLFCNGKISGTVLSEDKSPIEFANLSLYNLEGKPIAKTQTDHQGFFQFNELTVGTYVVKVSYLGFSSFESTRLTIVDSQNLIMEPVYLKTMKVTDEVKVVAEKKVIQIEPDKKIFNVDKSLIATGGTTADVLNQVPSVSVDNNGNVSLRGKSNVTILINGKQSSMFGSDASDIVQQLPAGSIDRVEIMSNPSSKYDAQGMNGIINIVLKKSSKSNKDEGNISLGIGTGSRSNAGLNLGFNRKKHKFSVGYNYVNSNRDSYLSTDRITDISNYYFNSKTIGDHSKRRERQFLNSSYELEIDSMNTITIGASAMRIGVFNYEQNYVDYLSKTGEIDSNLYRLQDLAVSPQSIGGSINYKHVFDKKSFIVFNTEYNNFFAKRYQDFITKKYQNGTQLGCDTLQEVRGRGNNVNWSSQVDLTTSIFKKYKFEVGAKDQKVSFVSTADAYKKYNQASVYDSLLSGFFDYSQNNFAVYSNISREIKKWVFQAGLRYENFKYNGSVQNASPIKISYSNLFPTVFTGYKLNDIYTFQMNYSKRVNRPDFFALFPYYNISDPLNIRVGNPALQPEFIHLNELTCIRNSKKNWMILATVYSQYTTNLIQRVRTYNLDGTSVLKPQNFNYGFTYGIDVTSVFPLYKNSDWTLNINAFKSKIAPNSSKDLSIQGQSYFAKSISNFALPKAYKLQWTVNFFAKTYTAQGNIEPFWWTDLAAKKSFFKNKLSLTLAVNDIFNTNKILNIYSEPTVSIFQKDYQKDNTRFVQFTCTWNFLGKSSANTRRTAPQNTKDRNSNFGKGGGEDS